MYLRPVGCRFTQMYEYFLVMNSKRYSGSPSTLSSVILRLLFLIKLELNWKTVAAGEKLPGAMERSNKTQLHVWRRRRDLNPCSPLLLTDFKENAESIATGKLVKHY